MNKIGIITIFDENNYGNRLQNYAVQEVLKSLGFDVETINNVNIIKNENYFEKFKKVMPERREKFLKFNKENLKITEEIIFHHEVPENFHENYDYFVIGSDQIWNYKFEDRFSDFSFATFAPKEKRISFSASFGISSIKESNYKQYEGLKDMKAISVREDVGKEIVEMITGRQDAEVLIDPTMMLSAEKWTRVMRKPEKLKSSKYILKYFLGEMSEEKNEEIERFAKENNCDIIDVLDENAFYGTGPSEFIYLIKNSFMVLTDSFHSCVFSIIFNKPFLIFEREEKEEMLKDMNSRIVTLLEKFELKNKEYNGKIYDEQIKVDYSKAYCVLEKERKKAKSYLKKVLEV